MLQKFRRKDKMTEKRYMQKETFKMDLKTNIINDKINNYQSYK